MRTRVVQAQGKPINGEWQESHMYVHMYLQSSMHKQEKHCPISVQDFKAAWGLNPHQLGKTGL